MPFVSAHYRSEDVLAGRVDNVDTFRDQIEGWLLAQAVRLRDEETAAVAILTLVTLTSRPSRPISRARRAGQSLQSSFALACEKYSLVRVGRCSTHLPTKSATAYSTRRPSERSFFITYEISRGSALRPSR